MISTEANRSREVFASLTWTTRPRLWQWMSSRRKPIISILVFYLIEYHASWTSTKTRDIFFPPIVLREIRTRCASIERYFVFLAVVVDDALSFVRLNHWWHDHLQQLRNHITISDSLLSRSLILPSNRISWQKHNHRRQIKCVTLITRRKITRHASMITIR